ncbi:MAG TPA: glutaredoxin family protein [Dehalococcoidia bacterium]|nr:glutaredoxin family protein [Dehalococcoidia bacterium]
MIVTLYTKEGCELCEKAVETLRRLQTLIQFETELVYIEDDEELYERYGERVPVVAVGGQQIASAPIDEATLRAKLASV